MSALPARLADTFEAFWRAYPRRPENPKAAARAVFGRLAAAGVDPAAVIAGAQGYAAWCARERKDPKFIPHARTWLVQRRFEDFQPADAPAAAPDAEPLPDHPLAALRPLVGEAAWASWLQPLTVDPGPPAIVTAPTRFALDRVRLERGGTIEGLLGPVTWRVATNPKESR